MDISLKTQSDDDDKMSVQNKKTNKKRPISQVQKEKKQQQGQDESKKKKTNENNNKKEQVFDKDLARRFLPSKKRNQVKKDELTKIQNQLNDISLEIERDLIRHYRLMKLQQSRKKKDKSQK